MKDWIQRFCVAGVAMACSPPYWWTRRCGAKSSLFVCELSWVNFNQLEVMTSIHISDTFKLWHDLFNKYKRFLSSLRNQKIYISLQGWYWDPGRQLAAVQVGTDGTDIINQWKMLPPFCTKLRKVGASITSRKNENAKMTQHSLYSLSINKAKSKLQSTTTQTKLCPLMKQDVSTAETWDISEKSVLRWSARTVTCSATWPLTATVAHRQWN